MSNDNPYDKPDDCRLCSLFKEPGPVWGYGNRNSKMLYVAEAPGGDEVAGRKENWKPLIGGSGRVQKAICRDAGLDRDVQMFRTNVVKCRPPGNRTPTQHEIVCCASFLIEEIEDVNPNVIVAAGDVAMQTLTGRKPITLWRGVPTAGPRLGDNGAERIYKVFGTWHPANVMRVQWNWPFAVHDMVRAKAEAAYPEIVRIPVNIERQATHERDAGPLRRSVRERGAVTFDFETTGLFPESSAIQICGFVGRSDQADVFSWSPDTSKLLQEFLDDPTVEVCGQNILYFDLPYAEAKGLRVWQAVRERRVFDSMVAFHLCNASYGQTPVAEQNAQTYRARGTEKDLSFIASNHTDIEYWKSKEDYKKDLRGVCGLDVISTDRSVYHPTQGIKHELLSYGMSDLYYKHVLPVHEVLWKMHQRGFKIDEELAAGWKVMLNAAAEEKEKTLREALGDPWLNLNSPKQLMDLVYGKLGLPIQYNRDKKRGLVKTLDAAAIEFLARTYPENLILNEIVEVRHLRRMESTYIDPGLETGWLHPHFGTSKTANGRLNGWNPNAQNVPEEMRDIWIPDSPDHIIISADSSQIEWRNQMVLSGDPVGLELLASGVDNHRAVAAETLGRRVETIDDGERHAAKFIVYGLSYGRGAASISAGHGLDLEFTDTFIKRFFARFRRFAEWREERVRLVKEQNFLANPWGRRRWWYTRNITEIYNFDASSCAADMMIDELLAIEEDLKTVSSDATLRLTVHDEVVVVSPKDCVKPAVECVRDNMQRTWPQMVEASSRPDVVKKFYPNGWFCPADIHVGTNWQMCKSKNSEVKRERAALEKSLGLAS